MTIKLLISNSVDPKQNLAIEEYLTFSYEAKDPILFFWQNANTIVVGRNQNTFAEVNLARAWADDVTIIRRNTGGGTVFHDLGNLCFSMIVNNAVDQLNYQIALEPIITFLNEHGVQAQFAGRNDIVVGEFKVSGNAQLKTKDKTLVHGTLLFDVDLTKIVQYLNVNEEKIKHQKIKSKSSRVKNIRELYEENHQDLSVEEFKQQLIDYYLQLNEVELITFNEKQIAAIQTLRLEKYELWEWTFGKNSDYEVSKNEYLEGKGFVQINLSATDGLIEKIKIFGDFFGTKGTEELEERLVNTPLKPEAILKVLDLVDLRTIFGDNFSSKDILRVIFK